MAQRVSTSKSLRFIRGMSLSSNEASGSRRSWLLRYARAAGVAVEVLIDDDLDLLS